MSTSRETYERWQTSTKHIVETAIKSNVWISDSVLKEDRHLKLKSGLSGAPFSDSKRVPFQLMVWHSLAELPTN